MNVNAAASVATPNPTTITLGEKKAEMPTWKTKIVEKFQQKIQQKIAKNFAKPGVDFKDPVKKWLWFAVFSYLAALVCYILTIVLAVGSVASVGTGGSVAAASTGLGVAGIFSILGLILGIAATAFFIIWLVKKFG